MIELIPLELIRVAIRLVIGYDAADYSNYILAILLLLIN